MCGWQLIPKPNSLSYLTAKRDPVSAHEFVRDLSNRVSGRFQITTDGFAPHSSIEDTSGLMWTRAIGKSLRQP